jgi:2-oxoglutarate dehydrogenase complex dehydrogenase (E1) component-like enzyme
LVIMSPKSMLRLPAAMCRVSDLVDGSFEMVLDDATVREPKSIKRVLLCSGKIGHELVVQRAKAGRTDVAIVRLEQLFPFPEERLGELLRDRYTAASEIVWVQEEPRNMGAWRFVDATLRERLGLEVDGITRPANASPAAGSSKIHSQEQEKILREAIGAGAPAVVAAK